jgi:hypothetical protein
MKRNERLKKGLRGFENAPKRERTISRVFSFT